MVPFPPSPVCLTGIGVVVRSALAAAAGDGFEKTGVSAPVRPAPEFMTTGFAMPVGAAPGVKLDGVRSESCEGLAGPRSVAARGCAFQPFAGAVLAVAA